MSADTALLRVIGFAAERLINAGEVDVSPTWLPAQHRVKLHSTTPPERLNGELERRAEAVGIIPMTAAIRLVGAILPEQNAEWAEWRARYKTLESIAPIGDDPPVWSPPWQPDRTAGSDRRSWRLPQNATPRSVTRPSVSASGD